MVIFGASFFFFTILFSRRLVQSNPSLETLRHKYFGWFRQMGLVWCCEMAKQLVTRACHPGSCRGVTRAVAAKSAFEE